MAEITIELPRLLAIAVDDELEFALRADSFSDALRRIRGDYPRLAAHLFNEQGEIRTHVLCLLNDVNSKWLDDPDSPLSDGDKITFLQAVTGG